MDPTGPERARNEAAVGSKRPRPPQARQARDSEHSSAASATRSSEIKPALIGGKAAGVGSTGQAAGQVRAKVAPAGIFRRAEEKTGKKRRLGASGGVLVSLINRGPRSKPVIGGERTSAQPGSQAMLVRRSSSQGSEGSSPRGRGRGRGAAGTRGRGVRGRGTTSGSGSRGGARARLKVTVDATRPATGPADAASLLATGWARLRPALWSILQEQPFPASREELYGTVEDICKRQAGAGLYGALREDLRLHCARTAAGLCAPASAGAAQVDAYVRLQSSAAASDAIARSNPPAAPPASGDALALGFGLGLGPAPPASKG